MNESEVILETTKWMRYAQDDLRATEILMNQTNLSRHVCWFPQQVVEKSLKAILVFLQIEFPFTHDLDVLRNLVPESWQVKERYYDLSVLTEWAVETRYPGE